MSMGAFKILGAKLAANFSFCFNNLKKNLMIFEDVVVGNCFNHLNVSKAKSLDEFGRERWILHHENDTVIVNNNLFNIIKVSRLQLVGSLFWKFSKEVQQSLCS